MFIYIWEIRITPKINLNGKIVVSLVSFHDLKNSFTNFTDTELFMENSQR